MAHIQKATMHAHTHVNKIHTHAHKKAPSSRRKDRKMCERTRRHNIKSGQKLEPIVRDKELDDEFKDRFVTEALIFCLKNDHVYF